MDRKTFLGNKFLKTRIMKAAETGESKNFDLECQWKTGIFFSLCLNVRKLRFVDFIKESTSVSVKFTFETQSLKCLQCLIIIVAQDAKFGECIV